MSARPQRIRCLDSDIDVSLGYETELLSHAAGKVTFRDEVGDWRVWSEHRVAILPAPEPTADPVNHPPHYTAGGIECIDAIRAALTPEEFRGFCKGNVIKYVFRERLKGGDESLQKAGWYLRKAIEQ